MAEVLHYSSASITSTLLQQVLRRVSQVLMKMH